MVVKSQNLRLTKTKLSFDKHVPIIVALIILLGLGYAFYVNKVGSMDTQITRFQEEIKKVSEEKELNRDKLQNIGKELEELKNQDQIKQNEELQQEITNIQETYKKTVVTYEDIISFRDKTKQNVSAFEKLLAEALTKLASREYEEAEKKLTEISSKITEEEAKTAAAFTIPQNIPQVNTPPGSGYSRQSVNIEGLGQYLVSIVAADITSTKVIVDTASDADCNNDCPVLPLATYVSRNGAFAGINGSYFCPAEYPSCTGKTNTFDLLVMNHKKTYFNSANNVHSNNPAVIFGDGYIRFVAAASQWGRDTSPNGVLSNYPLLVFNSGVVFGGDDDPKKGSKGGRSFVANKGNNIYIGVVHNATVAESARVLSKMGMENALNLDNGGSTALWSGGYKLGPGRNLPNAILFVRK